MTTGRPFPLIVSFALPLLFSSVCQQLYNVADSMIVGRFVGVNAFAALGAAGFYYWLVLGTVFGFAQGFGTLFSQCFGAKDHAGLRRALAHAILLTLLLSALLTLISLLLLRPVLTFVGTPREILPDARLYLLWVLSATPLLFAYNTAAAILRALGNSRTPLFAVILASLVNIGLDLLFVGVFHMGVAGVAIATAIATAASFLYCLGSLSRIPALRLTKADFDPDRGTVRELMRLSSPLALRNFVIGAGGLVIQSVINGYGTLYVAGVAAANKYFGVMNLVGSALDGAVAVFTGQNYGAMRLTRIKSGVRTARWIGLISSLVIAGVTALLGRRMIALLLSGSASDVAAITEIGYRNLLAFSVCLPPLYMLFVHRSALQGMGNAAIPMLSGFLELLMRMLSVLVLPRFIGVWGVYFADGLGWIAAMLLLVFGYAAVYRARMQSMRGLKEDDPCATGA